MSILLTGEELAKFMLPDYPKTLKDMKRAIARAQLKKVVEWGNETCPHDLFGEGTQCFKHACDDCWQALKKEVGL